MASMLSFSSSVEESHSEEEFLLFKTQLNKVQDLIEEYNNKIIDKTLCVDDLAIMKTEMQHLTELEQQVTSEKMKSNYVSYKLISLKMVQESYRICDWLLEKQCSEMDNIFNIDSYVDKIIEACADKENPFDHINILFKGAFKNINYFNLNFYGNIKSEKSVEAQVLTQTKKEYCRKSQKRQLEDQVIPDEVSSETGDNQLQITLLRVKSSLKKAVLDNGGDPVSFHQFAIDPFSLTYTIENLFHLASLVKDGVIKIERVSDDENGEFSTIKLTKQKSSNDKSKDDIISSLFTMNYELWQYNIKKYNITKRMIKQDDE